MCVRVFGSAGVPVHVFIRGGMSLCVGFVSLHLNTGIFRSEECTCLFKHMDLNKEFKMHLRLTAGACLWSAC